jgi:hypothetical protein
MYQVVEKEVKALCFGKLYDERRLLEDYSVASRNAQWLEGSRGDEVWDALPLMSRNGAIDESSIRYWNWTDDEYKQFRPTPILKDCVYFESVINNFKCYKERIRLMRLPAGKRILPHKDIPGKIRLHIPIRTHTDVFFLIEEHRLVMKPGELWYIDLEREHEVFNRSDVDRIHLVMDLIPNAWLKGFMRHGNIVIA